MLTYQQLLFHPLYQKKWLLLYQQLFAVRLFCLIIIRTKKIK